MELQQDQLEQWILLQVSSTVLLVSTCFRVLFSRMFITYNTLD
jgi:hypothetical protein